MELVSRDYDERPTCEKIDDLANVKAIACGYNHNLMLLENGEVYSFGRITEASLASETTSIAVIPQNSRSVQC